MREEGDKAITSAAADPAFSAEEQERRRQAIANWLGVNLPKLRAYLRAMVGDLADIDKQHPEQITDDLLSETVQTALRIAGDRYDPDSSFLGTQKWLAAIARNQILKRREKAAKEQQFSSPISLSDEEQTTGALYEELRGAAGRLRDEKGVLGPMWVEQMMRLVRGSDAEIIRLRVVEDRPVDEVARMLRITEVNVRVRLHRALDALRRAMKDEEAKALGGAHSLPRPSGLEKGGTR